MLAQVWTIYGQCKDICITFDVLYFQIVINDEQKDKDYFFTCNQWLFKDQLEHLVKVDGRLSDQNLIKIFYIYLFFRPIIFE